MELRSLDKHIENCDDVESDPKYSIEHGINFRSSLLELKYFNVCSGLLPDVMHDILEGVVQYELKLFIHHCIDCRYFRPSTPEPIMAGFELGYMEQTSRPTPISPKTIRAKDNTLRQNGI